jgi:hypothetical protein
MGEKMTARRLGLSILLTLGLHSATSRAEVVWYPLPPEAYSFGRVYPEAQRLLYAFDYGHALVYEKLLHNRGKISDPAALEDELLATITKILNNPPHVKMDEASIAPTYTYTFPLVVNLFDWSHMLHQWVYDVLATSENRGQPMIDRVNEIYAVYKSRPEIMITDECKTMEFMDGQYFSKAFRRGFPSFNLLIWAYHWFQIRLYEALLEETRPARDAAVAATVAEFRRMVSDLPDSAPFDMMPQTAVEAPRFAALFPHLPAAFDNNHMLHDVISDILVSGQVTDEELRTTGVRAGRMAQDPNQFRATTCDTAR